MFKFIKNWIEKKIERKLLSWIASHNIKYEKYKFFYGFSIDVNTLYLSNIDNFIYDFIEAGGQLVYAYDEDIYKQVKELKKQNIPYCFTENKYETKLNYLIEKKEYILEISGLHRIPYFINKVDEIKTLLQCFEYDFPIRYLWVGSDTLEEDIEKCKHKKNKYRFTIQEKLIEVLYE